MQRFIILKLYLTTVVNVGCRDSTENLNSVFGGSAAIETVQNAISVNAFRLATSSEYQARMSDYEFIDGPIVVPADSILTLRSTLLDASSYERIPRKAAYPIMAFGFNSKADWTKWMCCFVSNATSSRSTTTVRWPTVKILTTHAEHSCRYSRNCFLTILLFRSFRTSDETCVSRNTKE